MRKLIKIVLIGGLALLLLAAAGIAWHLRSKLPQRSGEVALSGLKASVQVRFDEAGVPHIRAENEPDLYRALGWLHAQDRLFQMEVLRRLARGELAEILGPSLVETDRLFRTLSIRAHADAYAARMDPAAPTTQALAAYLDGINQYQATQPAPLEFDVLGIPKRPFTGADAVSVAGYLAYSFAAALRSEPVLTHVRDKLGPDYLKVFDLQWKPQGVLDTGGATTAHAPAATPGGAPHGTAADLPGLLRVAQASERALALAGVPMFEGSNAWAISGTRTRSGKPILAGDPHIAFAVPAVWWEAHLQAPGFELYGHFQALNPMALLGFNSRFGWSLTMFQNDDMDLVVEKTNPANANQVMVGGRWVDLQAREESIAVKGAAPVKLQLKRSPHGPIINEAMGREAGEAPVALWWAFLETDNPVLEAFYKLNRADTLAAARQAASGIHAPGLNVVWANSAGDIAWWAAARLPIRPEGVDPNFILDGTSAQADKLGYHPFAENPQEENPARGYVVSANHQPTAARPVPGYYHLADRVQRIDSRLREPGLRWDSTKAHVLQLESGYTYPRRVLAPLADELRAAAQGAGETALVEQLLRWDGDHAVDRIEPTLFTQFLYEIAKAAFADEMGEVMFPLLLRTRAFDEALPRLAADPASPWWDDRATPLRETRKDIAAAAWRGTLAHLGKTYGTDSTAWTWGRAHTLTHVHALGRQKPLDRIFNVGPFDVPGGHETPNNLSPLFTPAPWPVNHGPSTRRVIDFAEPQRGQGINPVGQSGVFGDKHYADQAQAHARGESRPQHLAEDDVAAHTASTLLIQPR